MRSTAVRLSITLPQNASIRWPELCSACGSDQVAGVAAAIPHAPPVPFCPSCLRVHRRWTNWIRSWLLFALAVTLGPLLYIGAALDRPQVASRDSYHNYDPVLMALAFFAVVLAAVAAGIGYTRRQELLGVHLQELQTSDTDDPHAPLKDSSSLLEMRFKNHAFYSATVEANSRG